MIYLLISIWKGYRALGAVNYDLCMLLKQNISFIIILNMKAILNHPNRRTVLSEISSLLFH